MANNAANIYSAKRGSVQNPILKKINPLVNATKINPHLLNLIRLYLFLIFCVIHVLYQQLLQGDARRTTQREIFISRNPSFLWWV